jgi:hypothetical protein
MLGVVMAQGDVGPVLEVQLAPVDNRATKISRSPMDRVFTLYLQMYYQELVALWPFRPENRPLRREQRLPGDGEDAEIEIGVYQPAGLGGGDLDSDFLEQPENRSGLYRARGVVVSGDQNYRGFRHCVPQTLKLPEREDDGGIGRPNRMKKISCGTVRITPSMAARKACATSASR